MSISIDQEDFTELKEIYAELLSSDYEEEGFSVSVDEITTTLDKFSDQEVVNQVKDSEYEYLLHPFLETR